VGGSASDRGKGVSGTRHTLPLIFLALGVNYVEGLALVTLSVLAEAGAAEPIPATQPTTSNQLHYVCHPAIAPASWWGGKRGLCLRARWAGQGGGRA
jgi:hypothetical protein